MVGGLPGDEDHCAALAREWKAARLREVLRQIEQGSPPDDWDHRPAYPGYDYTGYGKPGDPNYVEEPDGSNYGDVWAHGVAVGRWLTATLIRTARTEDGDGCKEHGNGG